MRIIGGHKSYRAAIDESYRINAHNPGVWYSRTEGFSACSTMHARDDNELVVAVAGYSADKGDRHQSGSRSEYDSVRRIIDTYFGVIDSGKSVHSAQRAADEAGYDYD